MSKKSSVLSRFQVVGGWILTSVLILAGVTGFFTAFVGAQEPADQVLFGIISLLATALGLERVVVFSEMNARAEERHLGLIDSLHKVHAGLEQSTQLLAELSNFDVKYKPLIGYVEVYTEAERIVELCSGTDIIRTTSLGVYPPTIDERNDLSKFTANDTAYFNYIESVAKKVGAEKEKQGDIFYKVVMGSDSRSTRRRISLRKHLFEKHNSLDRLFIHRIDSTWSLDLLIAGNDRMIIGFPTVAGDREIRLGVSITDRDFVRRVIDWYEGHLWSKSQPVELEQERE